MKLRGGASEEWKEEELRHSGHHWRGRRGLVSALLLIPWLLTVAFDLAATGGGSFAMSEGAGTNVAIGGEEVALLQDRFFSQVRGLPNVNVGVEDLGVSQFSFRDLTQGGGKGGGVMQFTKNGRLLVKQVSKDDQASLELHAEAYTAHVTAERGKGSLLARIFFYFRRTDGSHYMVMNSWMPNDPVDDLYDLKGCMDDKVVRSNGASLAQVHKRWYMVHWLVAEASFGCCLPTARTEYYDGKKRARGAVFGLERHQHDAVQHAIGEDVTFLKSKELMDYSLILGVLSKPVGADGRVPAFPPGGHPDQPYVVVTGKMAKAYYLGIIDFLQGWTGGKKVAHVIKLLFAPKPISTVSPTPYADQFWAAQKGRFHALADSQGKPPDRHPVNGPMLPPGMPTGYGGMV